MKTNIHFWSYLTQIFLEWEVFQTEDVQKIKTQILFSVTFFQSCHWWDNVEKYSGTGRVVVDSVERVHCMLGT